MQDKEELGRNYPNLRDGSPLQAHANFHSRDKGFSPRIPVKIIIFLHFTRFEHRNLIRLV